MKAEGMKAEGMKAEVDISKLPLGSCDHLLNLSNLSLFYHIPYSACCQGGRTTVTRLTCATLTRCVTSYLQYLYSILYTKFNKIS